jgi:acetolactate synthase II small subunit
MKHRLNVYLQRAEGALLRTLGTIERRGFEVLGLNSSADERGMRLTLDIDDNGRTVGVLCRQLGRLYDVIDVHAEASGTGHAHARFAEPARAAAG